MVRDTMSVTDPDKKVNIFHYILCISLWMEEQQKFVFIPIQI